MRPVCEPGNTRHRPDGVRAPIFPSKQTLLIVFVLGIAAAMTMLGCGGEEPLLQPTDLPQQSKVDHSLDADCLGCHPGYGSPQAKIEYDKRGGGPLLAPKTSHEDYWCWDCHDYTAPTGNLASIHPTLWTPYDGSLPVVFLNREGPNSFADGDATYDGVCEVCHTITSYHRNNPSGSHGHSAGGDCTACHEHDQFWQATGGGDCTQCHNTTQPEGQGDYRRQVVSDGGSGGDFARLSHHVSDGSQDEIVTQEDCTVCHNQSNHQTYTDGASVYLNDPAGGAPMLYDGTASSLEPFCIACHDGTPSSPFSSGRAAPQLPTGWGDSPHKVSAVTCYEAGGTTGCHTNGHGSDFPALLQDRFALTENESYSRTDYDLCWQCHSEQDVVFGDNRFEDLHEKHVQKRGASCAYCHNMHAPYDAGEGLISFEYAIRNGWDIELVDGRDLSEAFWISPDGQEGACYIKCHNKRHRDKDYERTNH